MLVFYLFFGLLLFQRGLELVIAKRNERYLLSKGGYEVGREHYKYLVLLHAGFFCTLYIEVVYYGYSLTWWSLLPFSIFVIAQIIRIWSMVSLGRFWNTKIIILPEASLVRTGPYQYVRHPNYMVVATEILVIPLIFGAVYTAILFSLLNAYLLLFVRIPVEEKALKELIGND